MKNLSKKEQSGKQFFALSKESIIGVAKKIVMAGFLIGIIGMPSDVLAQKRGEKKDNKQLVRIENKRGEQKKDIGGKNIYKPKHEKKRGAIRHDNKAKHNHAPVIVHKPAPRPVVVHHKPAPHPVVVHHCDNNAAEAAAVAIGLIGFFSLLTD